MGLAPEHDVEKFQSESLRLEDMEDIEESYGRDESRNAGGILDHY